MHFNNFSHFFYILLCHLEMSYESFESLASTCAAELCCWMDCNSFCLAWSVKMCCKTSSILFPSQPFLIQISLSGIHILNNNSTFLRAALICRRSLLNFIWVDDLPGLSKHEMLNQYIKNTKEKRWWCLKYLKWQNSYLFMSSLYSASVSSKEYGFNLADSSTAWSISKISVSGNPKADSLSSPRILATKLVICTWLYKGIVI